MFKKVLIFDLLHSKNLCVREFIFPKMIIASVFTSLNISPQAKTSMLKFLRKCNLGSNLPLKTIFNLKYIFLQLQSSLAYFPGVVSVSNSF